MTVQTVFQVAVIAWSLLVLYGQNSQAVITLNQTKGDNITSGRVFCHDISSTIEFTCTGVRVPFLQWLRNSKNIASFIVTESSNNNKSAPPFTLFLDAAVLDSNSHIGGNMTSRLVGNLTDLKNGDKIQCSAIGVNDSLTVDYSTVSIPSRSMINVSVQRNDNNILSVNFTFMLGSNSASGFQIDPSTSSHSTVMCSSCINEACRCDGVMAEDTVNFTIFNINCGLGSNVTTVISVAPRVPSKVRDCDALPVYDHGGTLAMVNYSWTKVDDPPEISDGLSQDVRQYLMKFKGSDTVFLDRTDVCANTICSYQRSGQFPQVKEVVAENIVGLGKPCLIGVIDSVNRVLSLHLATTNPLNQTVGCSQLPEHVGTFECEFCYGPSTSCQNLTTCIKVNSSATAFPQLSDMTYCYHATARVNGSAVAVINGTFNTACLPQELGGSVDAQLNVVCNSGSNGSVSFPNGVVCYSGTIEGSLATYLCHDGYSPSGNTQRMCQSDGNWNGSIPVCKSAQHVTNKNIAYLVLSVILWIPTVLLEIMCARVMFCSKHRYHHQKIIKIVYVIQCIVEILLLFIVVILWGVFGDAVATNSISRRDVSILAAFLLALISILLAILTTLITSILCYGYYNKDKESDASISNRRNTSEDLHKQNIQKQKGFLSWFSKKSENNTEIKMTGRYATTCGVGYNIGKSQEAKPSSRYRVSDDYMQIDRMYDSPSGVGFRKSQQTPPQSPRPVQDTYDELDLIKN